MILECISGGWVPGIGDPNLLGWSTVAAYLVATVLAFRVFLHGELLFRQDVRTIQKMFWFALSASLLMLAINKQLDFQSLFIIAGKCISLEDGWYDNKQLARNLFTVLLAICMLFGFLLTGWLLRKVWKPNLIALVGVTLILSFIVVRAATFMHFGGIDWMRYFGADLHWLLEVAGIILVIFAAIRRLAKPHLDGS